MKRWKTEHNFRDIEHVINSALMMNVSDFRNYSSKLSKASVTSYPLPNNKVVVAEFRKGSSYMYWKEDKSLVEFNHGE